jgi:hypothetical protein
VHRKYSIWDGPTPRRKVLYPHDAAELGDLRVPHGSAFEVDRTGNQPVRVSRALVIAAAPTFGA